MARMTYPEYLQKSLDANESPLVKSDFEALTEDEYKEEAKKIKKAGEEGEGEEGPAHEAGETPAKEEGEQEEGDEDEQEDEGEKPTAFVAGEKAKKSQTAAALLPTEEELLKSMELLAAAAASEPTNAAAGRLGELAKSATAGTLTPEQRAEMLGLLQQTDSGAAPDPAEPLRKSLDQPAVKDATDANEFLAVFCESIVKSFGDLAGDVRQGRQLVAQFHQRLAVGMDAFAKSLVERGQQQDELIKSLTARVAQLEAAPLPYRGIVQAPQATMDDVPRTARDGVPMGPLQAVAKLEKSQVLIGLRKLFNDQLQKSNHEEADRIGGVITSLDSFHGDWRTMLRDPELLRQIGEQIKPKVSSTGR